MDLAVFVFSIPALGAVVSALGAARSPLARPDTPLLILALGVAVHSSRSRRVWGRVDAVLRNLERPYKPQSGRVSASTWAGASDKNPTPHPMIVYCGTTSHDPDARRDHRRIAGPPVAAGTPATPPGLRTSPSPPTLGRAPHQIRPVHRSDALGEIDDQDTRPRQESGLPFRR